MTALSQAAIDVLAEKLGPFGHHPEVSTDFCIEVDDLEGYAFEVRQGLNFVPGHRSQWPFWGRLSRALSFAREATELDDLARSAAAELPVLDLYARGLADIDFKARAALAEIERLDRKAARAAQDGEA